MTIERLQTMKLMVFVPALAACLDPRVADSPGASTHVLPAGAEVASVADNSELASQVQRNDGIDDGAYNRNGGALVRGTGASDGAAVRFWPLGGAITAPAPLYELVDGDGVHVGHPVLVDALPGDTRYSPMHAINRVVITDAYRGERLTTTEALADAIDLGLIAAPEPTGRFVASPIVLPATRIEIGDGMIVEPELAYAAGVAVGLLRFGGERGIQPARNLIPTRQVSFLRAAHGPSYDASRPIFFATIPAAPAANAATYSALSVVLDVDLAEGVDPADITSDSQLFVRGPDGAIQSSTELVTHFAAEPALVVLPLQFMEGSL